MDPLPDTLKPDELNRLWQHAMHEERLFHDRMNFFSAMQVGLLGVFAILYNKEPALGVFVPLIIVALAFTLLWLAVQVRHWRYCVHVHVLIRRAVPEYGRTVVSFAGPGRTGGLSIARPLAGLRRPPAVRGDLGGLARLGARPDRGVKPGPRGSGGDRPTSSFPRKSAGRRTPRCWASRPSTRSSTWPAT